MTRLLEHHAKELLDRAGVSTPPREVARTRDEVFSAAARMGGRVVVKAQVSANRRAKAGGVRFADDPERAAQAAEEIFGRLFDGRPAESVALILGRFMEDFPSGAVFGHAGAVIGRSDEAPSEKLRRLQEAGALVAETIEDALHLVRDTLKAEAVS